MAQRSNLVNMAPCRLIVEPYEIKLSNSGEQMTYQSNRSRGRCCSLVLDLPSGIRQTFKCPFSARIDHGHTYCFDLIDTLYPQLESLGLVRARRDGLFLRLMSFVFDFAINRHRCPLEDGPTPTPVAHISIAALQDAGLDRALDRSLMDMGPVWTKRATRDSVQGLHAVTDLEPDASCVICLQEFTKQDIHINKIVRMPCRHVFHGDCIAGWLDNCNVCPLCRFQMPAELLLSSTSTVYRSV